MATVREYFDTDSKQLTVHKEWVFSKNGNAHVATVIAKIALDFEGNAKYWYLFVPETSELSACLGAIFSQPELLACEVGEGGHGVFIEMGHPDHTEKSNTATLQFTKRVHLYIDMDISKQNQLSLISEAASKGYVISIRARDYVKMKAQNEKPLAFISHDSRDKDSFVRELAHELAQNYCRVWYDEFTLKVGDSLRESIERGLKEATKCVVVLSPNFLANVGWGRVEFDSVFTQEIIQKRNVILPVWLNVTKEDVFEFSPSLANKVGLSSSLGVKLIASRLASVIKGG